MRVLIAGAGPAGLYAAYRLRRRWPAADITLVEQNPSDATFGFGVVFSASALDFLGDSDPETLALIRPALETWSDLTIAHRGERVVIDGVGFAAIARLDLIRRLQARVASVGIEPYYRTTLRVPPDTADWDLVIAADGVNSLVRTAHADAFGTCIEPLQNRFVWYGTTQRFETLTQTFVESDLGTFNAHHYRYQPGMSTFIVECDPATFARAGFASLDEVATKSRCEAIFADALEGRPLGSNKSHWRQFPKLRNARWHHRNIVLVGDALRTAHFSIGSGTRLALEDVAALVAALEATDFDVGAALPVYQAARQPVVDKLVSAADQSADWYERFPEHMRLAPLDLAWSYIQRSGRVDIDKLARMAPRFVARYRMSRLDGISTGPSAATPRSAIAIDDPVPLDTPGARAISFAVPERYNASRILYDNLEAGRGDRIAVTGPAGTLTYRELVGRASRFGNAFRHLGLAPGQRIVCLLDDTPDYPAAIFGAMRAGFVPVLLNTQSPADLTRFYIEDSGATVAVVEASLASTIGAGIFAAAGIRTLVIANGPLPEGPPSLGIVTVERFTAEERGDCPEAVTSRNDMAFWMYSSGSTGRPKGVVHLHHDMLYTAESYARHVLALQPGDVCFSVPKIFFAYGFGNSCTFPFHVGASAVLLPGRPEPASIYATIARFKPSVLFALPTLYTSLIAAPEAATADLSSVHTCISAAEILASETANAWQEWFGHRIIEGLGSTEMLHIYLSNTRAENRQGSAGKVVPGYEVRLVPADGTTDVARDAQTDRDDEGVLMVRGTSSAPFYWRRPDKTAETMRGEWLWTGDRFRRDVDGFHYFLGRADDLVKVSGQWVYPMEVELCLADHPSVHECAVLAVELADRRMTLKAWVRLVDGVAAAETTTRALQDYVKGKLVPYKYPREIVYLADLPKTGTGKLDRQALRTLTA